MIRIVGMNGCITTINIQDELGLSIFIPHMHTKHVSDEWMQDELGLSIFKALS